MLRVASLALIVLLAACAQPEEQYPISGEQCGPEDAVQDLRPPNCLP